MNTDAKQKQFSGTKLQAKLDEAGINQSEFLRMLIKAAPEGMKPGQTLVQGAITGGHKPGSDYLGLFATVLGCSVDDFFDVKS